MSNLFFKIKAWIKCKVCVRRCHCNYKIVKLTNTCPAFVRGRKQCRH